MVKLIIIIGITGNQGGSVAHTFRQDSAWLIRGLTRDISSPAAQELSSKGIEMVGGDLHYTTSLHDHSRMGTLYSALQTSGDLSWIVPTMFTLQR